MRSLFLLKVLFLVCASSLYAQYPYILSGYVYNSDGTAPSDGDIRITTYNQTRDFPIDTTFNGGVDHTFWASNLSKDIYYWFNWGDTILVSMENVNPQSPYFGEYNSIEYVPPENEKITVVELGDMVVPVEMVTFEAEVNKNDVLLKWVTVSQSNFYGFEIERSKDDITYEKICFIEGQETSNTTQDYDYLDKDLSIGSYYYRIKQIEIGGIHIYSGTLTTTILPPKEYYLSHNYPNPFNASTKFDYEVPKPSQVKFEIFNILGQRVFALEKDHLDAGYFHFDWNGKNDQNLAVASGTYIALMRSKDFRVVRKMLLLK